MKKNRVLSAILTAAMCTSLAACSGSAGGNSDSVDSGNNSNTLSVSIWDNNQLPGLKTIMDDFTKETGIAVEIQVVPWDQYWTLLEEHREEPFQTYSGCTLPTARDLCAMTCFLTLPTGLPKVIK